MALVMGQMSATPLAVMRGMGKDISTAATSCIICPDCMIVPRLMQASAGPYVMLPAQARSNNAVLQSGLSVKWKRLTFRKLLHRMHAAYCAVMS